MLCVDEEIEYCFLLIFSFFKFRINIVQTEVNLSRFIWVNHGISIISLEYQVGW